MPDSGEWRRYFEEVRGRAKDSMHLEVDLQAWRDNLQVKNRELQVQLQDKNKKLQGEMAAQARVLRSKVDQQTGIYRRYAGEVRVRAGESVPRDMGAQLKAQLAQMQTSGTAAARTGVRTLQTGTEKLQQKVRELQPYVKAAGGFCLDKVLRAGVFAAGAVVVARNQLEPWAQQTWAKTQVCSARAKVSAAAKTAQAQVVAREKYAQAKVVGREKYAQVKVVGREKYAQAKVVSKEKYAQAKIVAGGKYACVQKVAGARYDLLQTKINKLVQKVREPKQLPPVAPVENNSQPAEVVMPTEIISPVPQVTPNEIVTSVPQATPNEVVMSAPQVTPVPQVAPVEVVTPTRVVPGILVPVQHVRPWEQLRTLLREELPPFSREGVKTFFAYRERLSRRHLFAQIWVTGALTVILLAVFLALGKVIFGQSAGNEHLPEMTLLLCLPLVLAALKGLALVEQRLHDLNLSAWDILIFLVIFGLLFFLILGAIVGDMYKFMAFICWLTFLYVTVGVVALLYTRGTMGANTYGAPSFVLPDLDPWRHWWSQFFSKAGWRKAVSLLRQPAHWQLGERAGRAQAWLRQEYFTYQGRLNRKAYFYRVSYLCTGALGFKLLAELASAFFLACMDTSTLGGWALWQQADYLLKLLVKAGLVLLVCCQAGPEVRRLHDQGNSGWWALLALVPGINLVYWLRQYCCRGDRGSNAYGRDSVLRDVDDEY